MEAFPSDGAENIWFLASSASSQPGVDWHSCARNPKVVLCPSRIDQQVDDRVIYFAGS